MIWATSSKSALNWSDSKYFLANVLILLPFVGIYLGGGWTYLTPLVLFALLPAMEMVLPTSSLNRDQESEQRIKSHRFFDILLYINLPLLYALLGYFFYSISVRDFSLIEWVGMILSVGIICGSNGINVAHELGHRKEAFDRFVSQALLLASLYMHFYIEHNRGHHRWVATPQDPATSRRGEILYTFWFRSMIGGWVSAWRIEAERLKKAQKPLFSWDNLMLRFQLIQLAAILLVGGFFGWKAGLAYIIVGIIGGLMLESVNYLEHYGLQRKEIRPGVYEPVQPRHSWNSNHSLGRIMLYELTRHSDHHYRASRKYQVLRHQDEGPELPTGYPGMILLSMVPPLWFKVMHRRLSEEGAA